MKFVVCGLLLVLHLLLAAADPAAFSVSNQLKGGDFMSLDVAFDETKALDNVQLTLLPSPEPFTLTIAAILSKRLWVRGEGQSLQLADTLYVAETGNFTISNVSLLLSDSFRSARAIDVRGTFILENSSLHELRAPFIWLYGKAALVQDEISGGKFSTVLLKSGKAVLSLASVSVSHLEIFVATLSVEEFLQTASTITVHESRFEDNSEVPVFSIYKGIADLRVISSSFVRNLGVALDVGGNGHKVLLQSCLFKDNNNSAAVLLRLSQADVRIVNCTFTNNFDVGLHLWSFSGVVVLEECSVTKERGAGFFYLNNEMETAECQIVMRNLHISDVSAEAALFHRSNLIFIGHCSANISNITLTNVSLFALPPLYRNFLFFADSIELWLSDITVVNSSSTASWFCAQFSTFYLFNIRLDNYYSDTAVFFFAGVSTGHIANYQTVGGRSTTDISKQVSWYKSMYFVYFTSDVKMQNVSISDSVEPMGLVFSIVFSNYSMSNMSFARLSIVSVFASSLSYGNVSNLFIDRITGKLYMFLISGGVTSYSNILLSNSQLLSKSGVIGLSRTSTTLSNLSINNFTGPVLITSSRSTIVVTHLLVDRSILEWFTFNLCSSVVSLEDFILRESAIEKLSITSSNVTIRHSAFTSLRSQSYFVESASSNVSFLSVSLRNISTVTALALITQNSNFAFKQCKFEGLRAEGELGWQVFDSILSAFNTHVRYFNFGFFQAKASHISLANCTFAEGKNPVQSLKSTTAYGGVLSCVDCLLVLIRDCKFLNISARVGGAVAVKRKENTQELYLEVDSSAFINCKALQAGALFIQNISFTINHSVFVWNIAEQAGGGIFAAIKSWHTGVIYNSRFTTNSAVEGGAVKWSNAAVLLSNVTFQQNSAAYGPDLASYGVALSSSLTRLTGTESSGYSMAVVFELLDHYGHRVRLSPFKSLILLTTDTVAYRGNNSTFIHTGLFNFSDLTVYAPPASTQTVQAVFNDSQEDFALTIIGEIAIHFRSCISGEIHKFDRCEYCYPGYYSFSPSDSNCSFCPANAFCPGGSVMEVDPGYWRSAWNSSAILLCPFPAKCLGGTNSTCLAGFEGVLCNQCAPHATRIRAMECVKCRAGLVGLQLCASVLMILLLRWVILRLTVYRVNLQRLFVFKVVVSHCQYLSALCFLRVSFSDVIKWSLHVLSLFSALFIPEIPLVCLGVPDPEYVKALIGSLLPTALLLLEWLVYYTHSTESQLYSSRIIASSLISYMPYITLFTSIPLLDCQNSDSTRQVLFLDMSVTCWDGTHTKYLLLLVLPSIILNLVVPIATILAMRVFRPTLFNTYFPLWITGYKVKLYDVFLYALQYFFLCVVILTSALVPLQQVTYCFIVLIVVCTVNVSLQEWIYTSYRHFLLAEFSVLTVSLSLGFLSYYVVFLPGQSGTEFFVVVMVLLLNALFYGFCCGCVACDWLHIKHSDSSIFSVPPSTPIQLSSFESIHF